MQEYSGAILTGEFDTDENVFMLQAIRSFYTETTLNENQINQLTTYLEKHQNEDGQVLSLFDQLLVYLSNSEIKELLNDLEKIRVMYGHPLTWKKNEVIFYYYR